MFCDMVSDFQCKGLVRTARAQATHDPTRTPVRPSAHTAPTQMVDDDTERLPTIGLVVMFSTPEWFGRYGFNPRKGLSCSSKPGAQSHWLFNHF